MKSLPKIAEKLDISTNTIREYLERFPEFFPDPVKQDGINVYPPETMELIIKIHEYYQASGMTKEQIRVKLGGTPESAENSTSVAAPVAAAMDNEQFLALGEKLDTLTTVIENLASIIKDSGGETFSRIKNQFMGSEKLSQINNQITDLIELNKSGDTDNIEEKVLESDGTIIFSFGGLSPLAADSMNFAKAHKKPWIYIDLKKEKNPSPLLKEWLKKFEIKVLNVAGRNASRIPGLKRSMDDMISLILKE